MGVLQAARRLGLRIPHDLSVIGIDDHVLSEVMAAGVLQRVRDPTIPAVIVTAPTELVLRSTTASPGPARTGAAIRVAATGPNEARRAH